MKKTLLIIVGTLILLIVVGVWVYLFMYGTPKNSDGIFARFGIGGDAETQLPAPEETYVDVGEGTESDAPQRLRQLTFRPVAGATFSGSSIVYVEQGTGHIYSINLTTGGETLLNGTTIPQTADALFSPDGMFVAITIYTKDGNETVVSPVSLSETARAGFTLPFDAREISFDAETGAVLYMLKEADGASGYSYDLERDKGTQLFKIPLRDVRVLWGEPLYVYTTPTAIQEGYLYMVSGNSIDYVTDGAVGLTGLQIDYGIVVTTRTDEEVSSIALIDGESLVQPLPLIPEKCAGNPAQDNSAYCSVPTQISGAYPDDWYMGTISYDDTLWSMNILTGEATKLSNFKSESGQEIDVVKIGTNETGELLYFINKNTNTLWMFDTTL